MKFLIKIVVLLVLISACSEKKSKDEQQSAENSSEFELVKLDSFEFRRAYHGHEELSGDELDLLMNRNPEPSLDYENGIEHALYSKLVENNVVVDGNLNISQIDTLLNSFEYKFSQDTSFTVQINPLEYSKQHNSPVFELTFRGKNKIVLVDTLEFDFPPDVTFFTMDLNQDGKQELLTLYRYYIVNGDNFDLNIYELKKVR